MQFSPEDRVLAHLREVPDRRAVADGGAPRRRRPSPRSRTATVSHPLGLADDEEPHARRSGRSRMRRPSTTTCTPGKSPAVTGRGTRRGRPGRRRRRPAARGRRASQPSRGELVGGVHRVVHRDLRPGLAQGVDRGEDTGERRLLDATAVRGAEHGDPLAREVAAGRADREADGVGRHRGVGLARGAHDGGVGVVPEVEARVDRDAVPTHRDARAVDVAVGLGVAGLDDLVDVDALPAPRRRRTGWPGRC